MHHTTSAITPSKLFSAVDSFVNIPVIGMKTQPGKNTPCTINNTFNHLSTLFRVFIERPVKNVESAIIPYPSKSKLKISPCFWKSISIAACSFRRSFANVVICVKYTIIISVQYTAANNIPAFPATMRSFSHS